MPVSSAEIAQQAMQNYQQFHMMNASYGYADQFAGEAINAIGSSARPLIGGAAGLLGATPEAVFMGAGLNAGIAAFQGGAGLGAAVGTGMATGAMMAAPVALGAAALGAGAQWVGTNLMQGAQDQQRLNALMSQSFNFYNQQGGRGFTRTQMGQIGSEMREMAHHVGPGGELTSMRELTDIAARMGQMGMGRGIRDAQEFNRKFRDLIKTVKEVATDMNTSLGQALEFMQASKASGMFTTADQARFARTVQQTATGAGVATSEVTAAANIGSQISRSVGGLGRQGAMGGARAIGQIGAAVQAGILSEESIYNATGLTGAEGRQALATNMMSQTGSFLRTGKGRWMLAALAGREGTIDEEAAQRFLTGNVGVGETRQLAGRHLGEIGRAGFIRNEGRLRGAVLERFGAMAPAVALRGWASQRGIDINDMDDRSMLFAQRQLGMGRDELDAAMAMAQRLPEIARQQMGAQRDADYSRALGMDAKQRGLEGLKRRFDKAKEDINSKLQSAGQSIFTETSEYVDRWLNRMMGHTVSATTENIGEIYRSTLQGGQAARERSAAVFGSWTGQQARGTQMLRQWEQQGGFQGGLGGAGPRGLTWEAFAGTRRDFGATVGQDIERLGGLGARVGAAAGAIGGGGILSPITTAIGGALGAVGGSAWGAALGTARATWQAATDWMGGAGRQRKQLERAGFRFDDVESMQGEDRDRALQAKLGNISNMYQLLGGEGPIGEAKVSQGLKSKLLESYAGGELSRARTEDRPKALRALLAQEAKSDPEAAKHLQEFDKAGPTGQMLMTARMEESIGKKTGGVRESIQNMGDPVTMLLNRGRYATVGEADEAYGRAMLGRRDRAFGEYFGDIGGAAARGAAAGMRFGGPAGGLLGGAAGAARSMWTGVGDYVRDRLGGGLLGHIGAGAVRGAGVGAAAGMLLGGQAIGGGIAGAVVGGIKGFYDWTWGGGRERKEMEAKVGEAARSEKGMALVAGVWNEQEGGRERAMSVLANREVGKELKPMEVLAANSLIADKIRQMSGGDLDKLTPAQKEEIVKQAQAYGLDVRDFSETAGRAFSTVKGLIDKQEANRREIIDRMRSESRQEMTRAVKAGVLTVEDGKYRLSEVTERKMKALGPASAAAVSLGKEYLEIQNKFVEGQKARASGDETRARELEGQAAQKRSEIGEQLTRVRDERTGQVRYRTVAEQRALAKGLEGLGLGDEAEYSLSMATRLESLSRRGGTGAGMARMMGARLDKKETARLQAAFGRGDEAYGEELGRTLGLSSTARAELSQSKDFQEAMRAARGGGTGDAARLLESLKSGTGKVAEELKKRDESRVDPQTKMVQHLEKIAKAMDEQSKRTNESLADSIVNKMKDATLKVSLIGSGNTNTEGGSKGT